MKQFGLLFFSVLFFLGVVPVFSAQLPCTPLFGGGTQEDGSPFCLEQVLAKPAPTKAPSGFTTPNDQMVQQNQPKTKGGNTFVEPAPTVKTQPNTGPELLGLIGLIPAGIIGWKLRRKTS